MADLRKDPKTGAVFFWEDGMSDWEPVEAQRNPESGETFILRRGAQDWQSIGQRDARGPEGARLPDAPQPGPTARPAPAVSLADALGGASALPSPPQVYDDRVVRDAARLGQDPVAMLGQALGAMPQSEMPMQAGPDALLAPRAAPQAPAAAPALTPPPAATAPAPMATPSMPAAAVPDDRAAMLAAAMGTGVDPRTVPQPTPMPQPPGPVQGPPASAASPQMTWGEAGRRAAAGAADVAAGLFAAGAGREGLPVQSFPEFQQWATEQQTQLQGQLQFSQDLLGRGTDPAGNPLQPADRVALEQEVARITGQLDRVRVQIDALTPAPPETYAESQSFQAADATRQWMADLAGATNPEFDDNFLAQLSQGGGNMVGFIGLGLLTGGFGTAYAGAGMNAEGMYRDALAHGATEQDARLAYRIGAITGSTEAVPIQRALDALPPRLRPNVTNAIARRVADILQNAGEEAAQEALVEFANNVTASQIYDPERGWGEGVATSAAIGAILGGGTGLVGTALNREGQGVDPAVAEPEPQPAPSGEEPPEDRPVQGPAPLGPVQGPQPLGPMQGPPAPPAEQLAQALGQPTPQPQPEQPEAAPGASSSPETRPVVQSQPGEGTGVTPQTPPAGGGQVDPTEWREIPGIDAEGNETGRVFMENQRTGDVIPRAQYDRMLGQQAEALQSQRNGNADATPTPAPAAPRDASAPQVEDTAQDLADALNPPEEQQTAPRDPGQELMDAMRDAGRLEIVDARTPPRAEPSPSANPVQQMRPDQDQRVSWIRSQWNNADQDIRIAALREAGFNPHDRRLGDWDSLHPSVRNNLLSRFTPTAEGATMPGAAAPLSEQVAPVEGRTPDAAQDDVTAGAQPLPENESAPEPVRAPDRERDQLRIRLEGNETEARRQGRADMQAGRPRRLPSYINPTDMPAADGWYRGWDEANAAQPVEGVTPGSDLPDLPTQDRRQQWNAMSRDERERLLRVMGGFDKRDGNLTRGGQNAIAKNWQDLSAGARAKIEDAWRDLDEADAAATDQQPADAAETDAPAAADAGDVEADRAEVKPEGGDSNAEEVQGQGREEAVETASVPIADDRVEQKKRQAREVGRRAKERGQPRQVPGWAVGTEYADEWLAGYAERSAPGAAENEAQSADEAAQDADPSPTDAQKEAGNYRMGHAKVYGFDVTIENAKGSERSGTDSDGETWSVTMPDHYGYIRRTDGADGDHVDVYVAEGAPTEFGGRMRPVFVVNQVNPDTGEFDEHKVMLGYPSEEAARATYYLGFSDQRGPERAGSISRMSMFKFRDWLKDGDLSQPTAEIPASQPVNGTETETTDGEAEPAATVRLGRRIAKMIGEGTPPKSNEALMKLAADEFGGTIAEGAFSPKDAYEALELGVNLTIQRLNREQDIYDPTTDLQQNARAQVLGLTEMLDSLPTQTRRDQETDAFQQFSTPPAYGYAVNWIANIPKGARVLEPSAGNGGIAVFAKNADATTVDVNELAERRVPSLEALRFDRITSEDAEQIANIWAGDSTRQYDVVVMNPPFSSAGARGTKNTSATGAKHIEQALALLKPGGRLVAIMGHTFRPSNSRVTPFFDKLGRTATLRANVEVNGDQVYRKYGTSYDSRVLVIDKITGVEATPVEGRAETIPDLIRMLEEVRNDTHYRGDENQGGDAAGVVADGETERAPSGDGGAARPGGEPDRDAGADDLGGAGARGPRDSGSPRADGQQSRPEGDAEASARDGAERADAGTDGAAGSRGRASDDRGRPTTRVRAAEESAVEETAGGFAKYRPTAVRIDGAKEHPSLLVESSAMASVKPPAPNYDLQVPSDMVKKGLLSEAQLEQVLYAGAAHQEMLPAEGDRPAKRRGYMIGDGTGVGKTREIAGIIADNWARGRKKHILVSKDKKLMKSARRDFDNVGMKDVPIADLGGVKPDGSITKSAKGVMFTTYNTLARQAKDGGKSRIDQIVEWVGKDFDGTIIFDEAHLAGNAIPIKGKRGTSKPSQTALAVVDLQNELPNARVVYASATAATEVYNLAYADRLGIWGAGTPFPNVMSFVSQVEKGGIAAMEVVARDMKQMGLYMARAISYEGVEYTKVEHELSAPQRAMYDAAAQAWQKILSNITQVIREETNGGGRQRGAALAAFWGAHQRFFQQVLTSMQMPSVISSIKKDLDDGLAPVIQIVNTNEAATNRAMGNLAQGDTLDDIDITPRDDLLQYLETSFPVQQYEDYVDDQGNTRQRPVTDSKGNIVKNAAAVAMRDNLIAELSAMTLPGNPLDMIIETFGADKVAEVTGRSQRIVTKNGKKVTERRSQNKTLAEAGEFQAGKRGLLVFSDAGGTGMDFHADLSAKNQKRRAHYVLQAGWRADRAIQGFGRTHRTNQKQAPIYKLAGTNLSGHKRFTSSIARRLDQLGALTKGQSDTGGGGMFGAADNLENAYAENAVMALMREIYSGDLDGWTGADLETELGLQLEGEKGFNVSKVPPVPQFLNRLLNTTIDRQNQLFERFVEHMEIGVQLAIERGEFTQGVEAIKHDGAVLEDTQEAFRSTQTGATSEYRTVRLRKRNEITPFRDIQRYATVQWKKHRETGVVYAFRPASSRTDERGEVIPTYHRHSPTDRTIIDSTNYRFDYDIVQEDEAEKAWQEQIDEAPAFREETLHMVTGALLPIWDRLPASSPRIVRLQLDDGRTLLGRAIPDVELTRTLENLGVSGPQIDLDSDGVMAQAMQGRTVMFSSGHRIVARKVGGERRVEVISPPMTQYEDARPGGTFSRLGFQVERIQYKARAFVPDSDAGRQALAQFMQGKSITNVITSKDQARLDMFYSPLQAGLDTAKQQMAPAKDWKAIIGKMPGVKRAEIEWLGVDEWLDMQEGQVTREALAEFVRAGQIEVVESQLGALPDDFDEMFDVMRNDEVSENWSDADVEEQVLAEAEQEGWYDPPRFESYTEDGGSNYREILLRVPNLHTTGRNSPDPTYDRAAQERDRKRMQEIYAENGVAPNDTQGVLRLNQESDELRQINARIVQRDMNDRSKRPFVQSAHFKQENIVVHARVKDREGPNGERVLFVEEIQSDLASKWRESSESPEVTARRREIETDLRRAENATIEARSTLTKWLSDNTELQFANIDGNFQRSEVLNAIRHEVGGDTAARNNRFLEEVKELLTENDKALSLATAFVQSAKREEQLREDRLNLGTERTIDPSTPDTPFKEEATYALAVKRLLRIAAAQGYDRMAWTPGYMQAERWNNAGESVVNDVIWNPETDGGDGRRVRLVLAGGNEVAMRVDASGTITSATSDDGGTGEMLQGKKIGQVLGASMADRILNERSGEKRDTRITFPDSGYAIAYDQQTRKAVEKLAKGTGAKVEIKADLPDFGGRLSATRAEQERLAAAMDRNALLDLAESVGAFSGEALRQWRAVNRRPSLMQWQLDRMFPKQVIEGDSPVWSITITDALREKAMLPQPILQDGRPNPDRTRIPFPAPLDARLFKAMRKSLDDLGLRNVELKFDPFHSAQGNIEADFWGRMVITIGQTLNPRWTLGHEAVHAYRHMGVFSDAEWQTLADAAERNWLEEFGIAERYPDLERWQQVEEAVAEAFGRVYARRADRDGFTLSDQARAALRKIVRFMEAIRNWARGQGFRTADDIIHAMARGEFADRATTAARPQGWETQAARLMKQQRQPGAMRQNGGRFHIPDRRVWDTLAEENLSLFQRLRKVPGAVSDRLDIMRTRIQDRMLPFRRAQEAIERVMGSPIPEDLNVYLAEEMYTGRAGFLLDEVDRRFTDPITRIIAKTKGMTDETVGRYLYARHAVERNERIAEINEDMPDGGSGMTNEEAAAILDEIQNGPDAEAYREVAAKIDEMREWAINLRLDAGLMTEFEAKAWAATYKHYVPLKGWAETDNSDAELDVTGIGRGYNVRGAETQRALGRQSEAFNPLIAAITQAQEVAVRAEKNRVGQHLYRIAKDLPSKDLWTVKRAETRRVFNETTGLVEERSFSPITLIQSSNEFAVKINGEEHRVLLHDPRLARAMGQLGGDAMIGPVRALSHFSRYFSAMNTMLNPAFLPKNVMRDALTATLNVRRFPNSAKIQRKMLAYWPKALAGAYRGLGGKSDKKWAKYFREFEEAGGKVSFWIIENPESSRARIARQIRQRSGPLGMSGALLNFRISENPVLQAIERINLAADNAMRLAAFVAAREEGYTVQDAASLGKNLTVNFNRRGEWGSIINAAYTFSNAGFQGTHMILKSLKDSAYVRRAALGLIAIGYLLEMANAYLSDEDEDGELYYDKIPEYTHAMNAVLMLGTGPDTADTSVRMFLPYGYNVFPYMGNRIARLQRGVIDGDEAIGSFATVAFNSFSPISGQSFLSTISPTIAQPAVEMATNSNFFGSPIYPQYQRPGEPDAYHHFGSATIAAQTIAQRLNQWTGGTYAESGYIDVSPESIDHVSGFLTGGAGRFVGDTVNLVAKALNDEDIVMDDIPLLSQMYVPPQDWWTSNLYWTRREEIQAAHYQARAYEDAGDPVPHDVAWRAAIWRNERVRLEAERLYQGRAGRTQDREAAYRLLNEAYIRAMRREVPRYGESVFDTSYWRQ
jgi:predicted RNA methylase